MTFNLGLPQPCLRLPGPRPQPGVALAARTQLCHRVRGSVGWEGTPGRSDGLPLPYTATEHLGCAECNRETACLIPLYFHKVKCEWNRPWWAARGSHTGQGGTAVWGADRPPRMAEDDKVHVD